MIFNRHGDLEGQHAFLGASKYHWINYTDEKLDNTFRLAMAAQKGTELHAFAADAIRLGIKLPKTMKTMNAYVNDAIGFRMKPEQILFYSYNAFGCADAIGFRLNFLRIHDLKTGTTVASMTQLKVYAALFCLEYGYSPSDIDIELRIYQNDEVQILSTDEKINNLDRDEIYNIMLKIVRFNERIDAIRQEAEL